MPVGLQALGGPAGDNRGERYAHLCYHFVLSYSNWRIVFRSKRGDAIDASLLECHRKRRQA